jgi:hypothetical protein
MRFISIAAFELKARSPMRVQSSSEFVSQAGHGLNDPQEQQPLVIKLGDLK